MGPHAPLCERARQAGLGVIVIDMPAKASMQVIGLADHFIATNYTDVECTAELISVLGRRLDITGVLSLTEPGLLPSAQVNELLGIDDNPVDVIRRIVDKDRMRQWLSQDQRFAVPSRLVRTSSELNEFAQLHGMPVIVKPPDGAGSERVRIVRNRAQLTDPPENQYDFPLLAEKYLEGREFSVEAVSYNGEHTIIGITEKVLLGRGQNEFVEIGHYFPATLEDAEEKAVRTFVQDFLDLLGFRRGLSHTEVVLDTDTVAIIETHSRNGGDHIADLVLLTTGFDMLDYAIRIRTGLITGVPAVPQPVCGAAIRYFTPEPGVVREVYGQKTARYLPNVVDLQLDLAPGHLIHPVTSSNDRVGYVITIGADAADAVRHCDDAARAVTITGDMT
jgi:biotin carboxylase